MRQNLLASLCTLLLLGGCAQLSITVSEYTGDLSESYTTRLAVARGNANLALATIEKSPTIAAYFSALPECRRPREYLGRINAFQDDLRFASALKTPPTAGLPRPGEEPKKRPGPAVATVTRPSGETTRIEASGGQATAKAAVANDGSISTSASATSESSSSSLIAGAPRPEVLRALSAMDKELAEFATMLVHVSAGDMVMATTDETPEHVIGVVERLHGLGQSILGQTEFPDFGDLVSDSNSAHWRVINPVKAFGGLGKSEFVVIKDDAGNYQVKSAIFDPGDVVQAATSTATGIISTFARLHGVPLPSASGEDTADGLASTPLMEADTQDLNKRSERLRDGDAALRTRLEEFRRRHLLAQGGNTVAATFTANELTGETTAQHARRALEELRQILQTYRKRVEPELKQPK